MNMYSPEQIPQKRDIGDNILEQMEMNLFKQGVDKIKHAKQEFTDHMLYQGLGGNMLESKSSDEAQKHADWINTFAEKPVVEVYENKARQVFEIRAIKKNIN